MKKRTGLGVGEEQNGSLFLLVVLSLLKQASTARLLAGYQGYFPAKIMVKGIFPDEKTK